MNTEPAVPKDYRCLERQNASIRLVGNQYFNYDEFVETLDDPNFQEKDIYIYKSQSIYSGQWYGPYRHGKGT